MTSSIWIYSFVLYQHVHIVGINRKGVHFLLICKLYLQIEILLGKTANFDELMAAAAEEREREREAGEEEEQS